MSIDAVTPLDPTIAAQLRASGYTYFEIGQTRGDMPSGFDHQRREVVIGSGRARFLQCARAIMTWQVQLRAGISVATGDATLQEGSVARLAIGVGPLRIHAPARVVYVIDEPRHAGFAYGTLPGHPELGEERFAVEHLEDDSVVFGVAAFSRPGSLLTRAAGPLGPMAQKLIAGRYLNAMASLPRQ